MEKRITEASVLFVSVLKWVFLAMGTGALVGLSTAVFLKVLEWSMGYAGKFPYFTLLLPIGLFLSALIIHYLAPEAEGQGTDRVIEAVHKDEGRIRPLVVPVKLLATVVTLASGGSAGKVGPCAQIGGGLSSFVAGLMKLDSQDRKKLVICGISAGFAAVLGTPIAGAVFGVEVLYVGHILYEVLLPSFIAGVTGYQVASALGITYFHSSLHWAPVFTKTFFSEVIVAGIFFGLCSFLLIEFLRWGKEISERIRIWRPWKGILGGLVLAGLTFAFSTDYSGLGFDTIQSSLQGRQLVWYAFLLKMIFTSITLNFGGSGGIIVPLFFVGATSGSLLGRFFGDIGTFSALGLVSLLAGATNSPIAASILALELFGADLASYAAIACVISFLMTGHRSVLPTQVLAMRKTASMEVEVGKELTQVHPRFRPREKSLLGLLGRRGKVKRKKNRDSKAPG